METLVKVVGAVVVALALIFVISLVMAIPTMLLVNYVLSPTALIAVFGGPLGFWKAFFLNFLAAQLFKTSVATKS